MGGRDIGSALKYVRIATVIAGLPGSLQDIVVGGRQRSRPRVQGIRRMPNPHLCSGEENHDNEQVALPRLRVCRCQVL